LGRPFGPACPFALREFLRFVIANSDEESSVSCQLPEVKEVEEVKDRENLAAAVLAVPLHPLFPLPLLLPLGSERIPFSRPKHHAIEWDVGKVADQLQLLLLRGSVCAEKAARAILLDEELVVLLKAQRKFGVGISLLQNAAPDSSFWREYGLARP